MTAVAALHLLNPCERLANGSILTRLLLRADGTSMALPSGKPIESLRELLGATALDTVALHHLGSPLHVMLVDDGGHESQKPVNARATELYLANCRPGTTYQIMGDVAIVPDEDFAPGAVDGRRLVAPPRPGPVRLLRLPEVKALVGLSRNTIFSLIKEQKFPAPVKQGESNFWPDSEITAYVAGLLTERDAAAERSAK